MQSAHRRLTALVLGSARARATSVRSTLGGPNSESLGVKASIQQGFATATTKTSASTSTPELPSKTRWVRKLGNVVAGVSVVGTAAWVASGEYPSRRLMMVYTIPVRLARDVATAVTMVAGQPNLPVYVLVSMEWNLQQSGDRLLFAYICGSVTSGFVLLLGFEFRIDFLSCGIFETRFWILLVVNSHLFFFFFSI